MTKRFCARRGGAARMPILLCFLCTLFLLAACGGEEVPPVTETPSEPFPLDGTYVLVSSIDALDGYASRGITLMQERMGRLYAARPSLSIDTRTEVTAREILIGDTNRAASAAAAAKLAETDGQGLHIFLAQTDGETLVLHGNSPEAVARGTKWFLETYMPESGACIPADLCEIRYVIAADFAVNKLDAAIYDAAALAELAVLSSITVDGVPPENFHPDQREYTVTLPRGSKIPAVAAEGIAGTQITADTNGTTTRFRVTSQSGKEIGEYTVQIVLDKYNYPAVQIEKTPTGADAIAVIVHDDGTPDTASYLAEEFEKNDLCGTIALITRLIVENGVRKEDTIAFWQSILDTGRFSMTSHTRSHSYWGRTDAGDSGTYTYTDPTPIPYTTEPGRITAETKGSQDDLRSCFPGVRALTFAEAGFGTNAEDGVRISPEALALIKKYYITLRAVGGGVDTIPPKDPYAIKSTSVSSTTTAEKMLAYTDEAIAEGGMIVYLFHRIEGEMQSKASALFAHIGEMQKAGKLWCATFEDMSLYTEELRTAQASAKQDDEAIHLTLTDSWDNTLYNYPLTVRVEITEDWANARVRHADGKEEILPVRRDESGAFVHVKSVPDAGEIRITKG